MKLVHSRADFFAARKTMAGPVGLVPTMGALHAGHQALMTAAREASESVIATVFVNPLQFGPNEDFGRYPRTLDADVARCEAAGVDVVWAPSGADVYPGGDVTVRIDPGPLGDRLEGATRPGHFTGALTVVAKFFNLVRPDRAYFGQKDYQQLTLIRQMADDLNAGVEIVGVPTVREPDGLALSSRNVYLSATDREHALALSRALFAGRAAGPDGAIAVITAATAVLASEPEITVDYLELRSAALGEIPEHGPARLLVAARVGSTRLIDNVEIQL